MGQLVKGQPFNQVIMKPFTLLVVLMALMAAIEAAPTFEEEYMEDEADPYLDADENDNEKVVKHGEKVERENETAKRRKRSTYNQSPYASYAYNPFSAIRSYTSYNPYKSYNNPYKSYNQAYRSYVPNGASYNQAYRSYVPNAASYNQAYRSYVPSGASYNQAYRSYVPNGASYNQAYHSYFPNSAS